MHIQEHLTMLVIVVIPGYQLGRTIDYFSPLTLCIALLMLWKVVLREEAFRSHSVKIFLILWSNYMVSSATGTYLLPLRGTM